VFQRSYIYHPSSQDFISCEGFSEYEAREYDGTRFYEKSGNREGVIIYYHGNAGSACDRSSVKDVFEKTGQTVIFVEYTGYSNDEEKPSRDALLQDVKNMHKYLQKKTFEEVIVYGQSIGGSIASYHASLGGVDMLILVAPFSRLSDVVQVMYPLYPISVLLREEYDTVKWLEGYTGEVVIFHGDDDRVVPPKFSRILYQRIPSDQKEYITFPESGHNTLWYSNDFVNALSSALE
jgi:hypothetical protein